MADIYIGIAIMLFTAMLAGEGTYRLARRGWRWTTVALAMICAAGLALNVAYFRHSLWPAGLLPFSNVMVLGDPNPLLVAVLIGAGARLMPGSPARRSVLLVPLGALCLWGSYGGLFLRPPPLQERWTGVVCRQTSEATCGPAAAATLLAAHGIKSSEAEMAELCLTNIDGTSSRGVYRGLKLKTRGTGLRVEPYFGKLDDLLKIEGPVLLFVRLDAQPGVDPRYQTKWGWKPGVPHVVVMYRRRPDGRFVMGDPAVGPELWDQKAIETLWHGEGIRLVKEK
ncbi:MAG: hypothetical protein JWN40_3474 [Phycisphaerales bacterium]|nr:hypothetical protein [Phycisphaerales bacterium]